MKIGVCFFIESNLGGAATQADDLVTAAKRLGHDACLLQFTTKVRARNLWSENGRMPKHNLVIGRTGMKLQSEKLLLTDSTLLRMMKYLDTFDLLIFVGGCPHITRDFEAADFHRLYKPMYTDLHCRKVVFLTDPFWPKLYPYLKDVASSLDGVYAFAEAYRRIVVETGLREDVGICNFGSIAACDRAKGDIPRSSKDCIVWPHQWRSWKNPELLVLMAPHLVKKVRAYADGIEYHKIRRDRWEAWATAVKVDHLKYEDLNPSGKITFFGTVPQADIIEEFASCRWMLDLTGMSVRTGEPLDKFVGNYQCVNMECMMLGCVNFKYENTIEPHSQIPKDCVIPMPLITDPQKLAKFINKNLGTTRYYEIASRAKKWAMSRFDPEKVFHKCFVKPFE